MKTIVPILCCALLLATSLSLGQTYINGPFVTHPGAGPAGTDLSSLEGVNNIFGFGVQLAGTVNNRIADDFTVPCGEVWAINTFKVHGYQTNATTPTSTITLANYRIWSDRPDLGAATILHDFSGTNELQSSTWTNCYRVNIPTSTSTARAIYDVVMNGNAIVLTGGTYWLDFQLDGSLTSGPWAPPVTIVGQLATGNGMQFTGTWAPAVDGGGGQDFPFEISYTMGTGPCWDAVIACNVPGPGVDFSVSGGTPGNSYYIATAAVFTGVAPGGSMLGIDITFAEIVAQIQTGLPFVGVIGVGGGNTFTFGTPPGCGSFGIPLDYVGIEFSAGLTAFVQASPAKTVIL